MKRFTAILLTGMMIFTLASCGKKAQDTPTEPATETQAAEKVEMPTETEAVTEVVTEAATETQQAETQQEEQNTGLPNEEQNNSGDNNSSYNRMVTVEVKFYPAVDKEEEVPAETAKKQKKCKK